MNSIHKLTFRSLLMNKSRTAMTIVAIMLSCALITIIAGMGTRGIMMFHLTAVLMMIQSIDCHATGMLTVCIMSVR